MKRRVFCIEHHTICRGPYTSSVHLEDPTESFLKMLKRHENNPITPLLKNDTLLSLENICPSVQDYIDDPGTDVDFPDEWFFGFQNMILLRKWFTDDDLQTLHENGFNLVVYATDSFKSSVFKNQTIFLKRESKELFRQNLVSLIRTHKGDYGSINCS